MEFCGVNVFCGYCQEAHFVEESEAGGDLWMGDESDGPDELWEEGWHGVLHVLTVQGGQLTGEFDTTTIVWQWGSDWLRHASRFCPTCVSRKPHGQQGSDISTLNLIFKVNGATDSHGN